MSDVMNRYLPAAVLAVGCVLLSGLRDQKKMPPRQHIAALSVDLPGYAPADTTVADEERKIAGMSDYVLRNFRRTPTDSFPVSVYVGYYEYQVQGRSIHSPKNCLPGAGWEQLSAAVQPIQLGATTYPVNRFLLSNSGVQALVYYWYQGRGRVEANEYRVKWNLIHDAALYGRTDEALVRIVVPLDPARLRQVGPTPIYKSADSLATSLAQRLIPAVTTLLPLSPAAS